MAFNYFYAFRLTYLSNMFSDKLVIDLHVITIPRFVYLQYLPRDVCSYPFDFDK